ncbi:hypothetical protein [Nitrobacter sp.]|uniref:hypothetical protein n=1 Tax=Nitrobacter sp. TaxID=29420 RepID=UPI00399D671A
MLRADLYQHFDSEKKDAGLERYSGWYFAYTLVGVLIKERAALWVKRFRYSEIQALALSRQQLVAMVEIAAAVFLVMVIFSSLQTR